MSSTKFGIREKAVANFEMALNNAGMQRSTGVDQNKAKYYRGRVTDINADMFLVYQVTDNLEDEAADNKSFRRTVYINGLLYTRSGFSSAEYQDLAENIETQCKDLKIKFQWEEDGVDISIDQDSPISYVNFEAQQTLLMI